MKIIITTTIIANIIANIIAIAATAPLDRPPGAKQQRYISVINY